MTMIYRFETGGRVYVPWHGYGRVVEQSPYGVWVLVRLENEHLVRVLARLVEVVEQ